MAVGAKDKIDRKLVQMYANVQTSTPDKTTRLAPETVLDCMAIMALNNRGVIQAKKSIHYRKQDVNDQLSA